jgi:hypothetical protein
MLNQLLELQERTRALIGELAELASGPPPDEATLARVRWKLTQASAQRHSFLEQVVYPHLMKFGSTADQSVVQRLSDDGRALRAQSTQHVGQWELKRTIAEWNVYTARSAVIRAGMLARIAEEQRLLIPMLRRAGAPRPASSLPPRRAIA